MAEVGHCHYSGLRRTGQLFRRLYFDALRARTCRPTGKPSPFLHCGFRMKAGIVPVHVWLPEAHPVAPSHISALMSGVMLKVALYG